MGAIDAAASVVAIGAAAAVVLRDIVTFDRPAAPPRPVAAPPVVASPVVASPVVASPVAVAPAPASPVRAPLPVPTAPPPLVPVAARADDAVSILDGLAGTEADERTAWRRLGAALLLLALTLLAASLVGLAIYRGVAGLG